MSAKVGDDVQKFTLSVVVFPHISFQGQLELCCQHGVWWDGEMIKAPSAWLSQEPQSVQSTGLILGMYSTVPGT